MSRKRRGQMTTFEVGSYNKMVQMPTPRPKWVKKTNLHGEWLYPNSKKGFERTVCPWMVAGGVPRPSAVPDQTLQTPANICCVFWHCVPVTNCPLHNLCDRNPGSCLWHWNKITDDIEIAKFHGRSSSCFCLWSMIKWNHESLFNRPSHWNFAST